MAETTIRADGKSPLSCYVDLLVSVPVKLVKRLDRDAEAVRILTATPALPAAIRRAERWYLDRQREKQTGGIVLTQRIWTRRDERRVNMLRGLSGGWCPPCRAARYLGRLQPRSGASSHDKLFRSAVDEARRDGTAAVLCPKLEQAKAIYERLISAALSVAEDEGGRGDFDSAKSELGSLACELMNWTKQPGSSNTTPARLDVSEIQEAQARTAGNTAHRDDEEPEPSPTTLASNESSNEAHRPSDEKSIEMPVLSERKYLILSALLEMGAISANTRETTARIVAKAEGDQADPVQFKRDIAYLKNVGYVSTKGGRGGGCWLTSDGYKLASLLI